MTEHIKTLEGLILKIDAKLNGSLSPDIRPVFEALKGKLNKAISYERI